MDGKSYPHVISVSETGRRTLTIFLPGLDPIMVDNHDENYDRLLFEAEQGELAPNEIRRYILEANG